MRDVWARPARIEDVANLDKWLRETPGNLFDADILHYTRSIRFLATPHAYMPVQTVSMLESLAVDPAASELEVAKSIAELVKYAVRNAIEAGENEVYFICRDERVNSFAIRHGFECLLTDEKRGKLLRLKVGKL